MKNSVKTAQSIVGVSPGRPKADFYRTPEHATISLLEREEFKGEIWECACGDGAISEVLIKNDYFVYSSDLYDRGYGETGIDFLDTAELLAPNIVTNPPFTLAENFVSHAIFDLKCSKLVLLAKLAFLEGQKRSRLLEKTPLKNLYVFRKRLTMTRNGESQRGTGMIAFAWFVWELGYIGKPMVSWI